MLPHTLLEARRIVDALGLSEGGHVADLGAGRNGHFVFHLADAVGSEGRVYAVDLHPEAISMLGSYAAMRQAHNVHTVWGDLERRGGVAVPEASLHLALLVHTMTTLQRWEAAAVEARRLLQPGGRLVVIDWLPGKHVLSSLTPRTMSPEQADLLFTGVGCQKCDELSPSPWHWGRVYTA